MTIQSDEISIYKDKLEKIAIWNPNIDNYLGKLPNIPLDYEPSPSGHAAILASMFVVNGCLVPSIHARNAFKSLWDNENFMVISLPVRLIYELWGASHYSLQILYKMEKTNDIDKALEKYRKLTLGVRSVVDLPWGGLSEIRSIHINDFIRSLSDIYLDNISAYDFLCESCHPSFLRLSVWSLLNQRPEMWANKKFQKSTHELLRKTISILEHALYGIEKETISVLEISLPYILRDREENNR